MDNKVQKDPKKKKKKKPNKQTQLPLLKIGEQKQGVRKKSSSSAWTPKLQLAAEQLLTGVCWIPPKKDTQCPRAKEKPQQDGRRGAIAFQIKSQTYQRCSEGTNKTLCTPGPRERSSDPHRRLGQTCRWVFECLLQRQVSAVACHRDRGSGCSRPGHRGMWPKSSWRKSPSAPP